MAALVVAASLVAVVPAAAGAQQEGFSDVAGGVHKPAIDALGANGVLEGTLCGENMFCPDDPMKRSTMAVWLVRVRDGADPAAVSSTRFADVDASHTHAAFIERFAQLGVTAGCGTDPLRYCPDDSVTRAQMATFLVRAFDLPEAAAAGFGDTAGNFHASNIDRLAAAGVTAGCSTEPLLYCPNNPVTRAQMATFLARAIGLIETPGASTQTTTPSDGYKAIASGGFHACAIQADDTIACWGWNEYGETDAPDGTYKAVAAGGNHSCAIRTDDTIACWGWNEYGQTDAPEGTYKAVAAAAFHSCAIRTDNTIACWGNDGVGQTDAPEGTYKAVAAGASHSCAIRTDDTIACWGSGSGATDAPAGTHKTVTAGFWHSCSVRTDDTVTCWGNNEAGQTDAPAGTHKTVTAGVEHSCSVRTDDTVTCWGNNEAGQTGAPAGTHKTVTAGQEHSCAIQTDGTVTCWGTDALGQIGDTVEVPVDGHDESTQTPARSGFVAVEAGTAHACGVRADKTVQCWGDDTYGQSSAPSGEFISVAAGHHHSCAIRTDSTVLCWGDNQHLQSGDPTGGTITCSIRNGQLVCAQPFDPPEGQFIDVATGNHYSCGLQTDNTIRCWGFVKLDDQGRGTAFMTAPAGEFISVSSGAFHACGVRSDNTVQCWGDDAFGQDQQPDGRFVSQPEEEFSSVTAGGAHACGVRADNTVLCWGNNQFGQSGTESGNAVSCRLGSGGSQCFNPFDPPEGQFISVSAGWVHTCGVRTDNTVSCWGDGTFGQLSVPSGEFISVSADDGYTCGLRPDNRVECWGRNDSGESTPPAN